jgi:D-alanine-D-alanine ligase
VREIVSGYQQMALIEEFLPGREFTVAVLSEPRVHALPPMEIVFTPDAGAHPIYTFGHKLEVESGVRFQAPAAITAGVERALCQHAVGVFRTLGCRDVARIDVRLDRWGQPNFIECNPLPGLTPGWSDLCRIAAAAGVEYVELIAMILARALRSARPPRRRPAVWRGVGT